MPGQAIALVCFPHAGGSNATYNAWGARLAPDFRRFMPRCFDSQAQRAHFADLDALAEHLVEELAEVPGPLVFYGQSMGAILAHEVACKLAPGQVTHLLVSGRRAPQLAARLAPIHQLPESAFVDALRYYGGIPASFDGNSRLLQSLLPAIRADLALVETYRYQPAPRLHCPITAIHATDDPVVEAGELLAWQHRTCAGFAFHACSGDHFFHVGAAQALIDIFRRSLERPPSRSIACETSV